MTARDWWQSLFPPLRRPVGWRVLLPLLAFLVVYFAAVIGLELSHRVQFTHPAMFVLMFVTGWVWWVWAASASGLNRTRNLLSLLVRLTMVGLFVAVMAEPRAVRRSANLSVVFAVDVSDSVGEGSADRAIEFVLNTVVDKPDKDEAGLVSFGRNAAVELPPRKAFPFEALNAQITGDATDLEQALSLSAAMIPEESRGRIVLVSDGSQNSGSLEGILDQLASREIAVDVLPIDYSYDREVWIERLELPQFVKLGENYTASVVVSSLQDQPGTLILREGKETIYREDHEFLAGKTRFEIPIKVGEPGYYEYTASIELPAGTDQLRQNNEVLSSLYVEGQGKVLLVVDPLGEPADWESLLQAIREAERDVAVLDAYDFPRDPLSLMPYDCVVFVNVGQDAFDTIQLEALHDAIYNQGTGFLMVGGPNSFGPGGYHRTVVEKALPVSMDITQKKILPKGALVIILHTCEFPEGNTWGKRITKQAIKVLSAQDEVGVIAYTQEGEGWVFELSPAGQYDELVPKINGIGIGDMPAFGPTMQIGLAGLAQSDAATKHMIIISDGDPTPPPPSLVQAFRDAQVTMSTVAVFPHQPGDVQIMRSLASATGGRTYFPRDPSLLPSIFIKEAKTLKRSMLQQKTIEPEVGFPSQVLDGIDALPPLHGYVLTSSKPMAETILITRDHLADVEETDPVLAIWRYGLATTAAFTSDLSLAWGRDWVDWEKYRAFVQQLLIRISRVREASQLRMWTYTSGGEATVMVEDFHPQEMFLDLSAKVAGPRDHEQTLALKQVGPRRYQVSFPLWGTGRYQVMSVGVAGTRTERAFGGFIVPYSPEYTRFRSDPILLEQIVARTGGKMLNAESRAEDIFDRGEPRESTRPVFDWLLITLACLLPLDVGIRRVQIDGTVLRDWFGFRRREQSTATMGALLQRKQAVDSQLDRARQERPRTTIPNRSAGRMEPSDSAKTGKPASSAQPGEVTGRDETSTTQRLLELKRRRQTDD